MLNLLYPGRQLVLDSPLAVDEVTRRLQREIASPEWRLWENRPQMFQGTFENGRFGMMRLVRGRNSFRPVMTGLVSQGQTGTRLVVRLQLHPLVLGAGVFFALIAGTIASIAAPAIPVIGGSPLLVRLLAMAAVMFIFAAVGSVEGRTATRLLSNLVEAQVHRPRHVAERSAAQQG